MIRTLLAGALGAAWATTALAHVTLENQEAKAGASYKATFRVPHGCEGTATTDDPRQNSRTASSA